MKNSTKNIKRILLAVLWCGIGLGAAVLMAAAVKEKDGKRCRGVEVEISGVHNNFFIDESDVIAMIKNYVGGKPTGQPLTSFNLRDIEHNIEQDLWIRNAELYFDNNDLLKVNVDEREPVARVFAVDGKTFYIDSSLKILPLSEKFSARLPVFTGFMHRSNRLSKADSSLLSDIRNISLLMQKDSFLMAMIEQVDITPQRQFEMIPKIGKQLIVFGDGTDAAEKFNKLKVFYKAVITKAGWSRYSNINLQYKNQVVAKIKDAVDKTSDSLRALQIMQLIAERAAKMASDSVQTFMQDTERNSADSTLIQHSIQRDEPSQGNGTAAIPIPHPQEIMVATPVPLPEPAKSAVIKPVIAKPVAPPVKTVSPKTPVKAPAKKVKIPPKPPVKKPVIKPPLKPAPQPKAVMQKPAEGE